LDQGFEGNGLQLNQNAPTEAFAKAYLKDASEFLGKCRKHTEN